MLLLTHLRQTPPIALSQINAQLIFSSLVEAIFLLLLLLELVSI